MDALRFKSNSFFCLVLTFSLVAVSIGPAAALAQDDSSVAALRQIGRTFATIAEKASPSVVILVSERPAPREPSGRIQRRRDMWPPDDSGDFRFAPPGLQDPLPKATAQGLGFVVSADGYILTARHVVDRARKIRAKLADGRDFEAKIIGTDPETDVAVVKIDADNLPALVLGDSDTLQAGDWVVGIGNALGLGRTFAAGLVTAKDRRGLGLATLEGFIQTDINLNFGDGGGPLLDLDGNVVGMNAAIVGSERGSGMSLAVPVNVAKQVYEQIVETGTVERGFLGVMPKDIDAQTAEALGLETVEGALIAEVVEDSAAEKAAIKKDDIIVEFNGEPLKSAGQLLHRVAALKPGTEVEVVVLRDGKRQTLTVTLGKRPMGKARIPAEEFQALEELLE